MYGPRSCGRLAMSETRYKPLKMGEAIPIRCECCEPARRLLHTRTGPETEMHYCPTTRAAYLPKRDRRTGEQYLIRGLYRGEF